MGQLIQITGLPRSGTAFCSVALSLHPEAIGLHELAATDRHWKTTIDELLQEHRWVFDCGTYQYLPRASRPEARTVWLQKNPEVSRLRSNDVFGFNLKENSFQSVHELAEKWAQDTRAIWVAEGTLFTIETLEFLWAYSYQGAVAFPHRKIRHLLSMNIQRQSPREIFTEANGALMLKEAF